MHEKLKFSFGHIIAFVALIFWGYVTFCGVTYYTGGNYLIGASVSIGIALILLLLLFRLQLLKSVNEKFEKYIIHERITLIIFSLACCVSFLPFSHFWTVKSHDEEILEKFEESLQKGRQLFVDYDNYSMKRINALEVGVDNVDMYGTDDELVSYYAMLKGIRLQLLPEKYKNLKTEALEWITQSEKAISIWNVFLMGNVNVINNSLHDWHNEMSDMSTHITDIEHKYIGKGADSISTTLPSTFDCTEIVRLSINNLDAVVPLYTTAGFPTVMAWLTGIIVFFMLYLPWIIQARSPKSMVTLWGKRQINTESSHTQVLKEGQKIQIDRKKSHLNEQEQVHVTHHGQKLSRDEQQTTHKRRALTLEPQPESEPEE
jgi:hypothetical protein